MSTTASSEPTGVRKLGGRPGAWLSRALLGLLLGAACHECGDPGVSNSGDLVGGACFDHRDCVGLCLRGKDFPGGTCSVECDFDGDCPDGTFCIERQGGVCLLACEHDGHCRRDYECETRKRRGHPGDAAVCIND